MTERLIRWSSAWLLVLAAVAQLVAQEVPPPLEAEGESDPRQRLEAIREHLVELRFEQALTDIEFLLAESELSSSVRAEGLILRSQTHVAFGDLDAAEVDYRKILELLPAYEPETSLTPKKALARFRKVQGEMIGRLRVLVVPSTAEVRIDGRPAASDLSEGQPVLAGRHTVRVEKRGFDPAVREVELEAGAEEVVEIRLVPNAVDVVIRSEPEDVEVFVDGRLAGRTTRDGAEALTAPAELRLLGLSPGDHVFELRKPCFRTERRRDQLAIDLLDPRPKVFRTVLMQPVRASVALEGLTAQHEVRIDGERSPEAKNGPVVLCPGDHTIEVRAGNRMLWRAAEQLRDGERRDLVVRPRPNVTLVGVDQWPSRFVRLGAQVNVRIRGDVERFDASSAEDFRRLGLSPDTDLALGMRPSRGQERWFLYSPILDRHLPIESWDGRDRPRWNRAEWGFRLVDSSFGGANLVASVTEDGPAWRAGLRPGDRLRSLGGLELTDARQARAVLTGATPERPLSATWIDAAGESKTGDLRASIGPAFGRSDPAPLDEVWSAAWAAVDAIAEPESASVALGHLARLLAASGQERLALATWQRVRFDRSSGIGNGTVDYRVGDLLTRLGRKREAIEAFRRAAKSTATALDDGGPPIAPAARARLAALGDVEP